MSKLADEQLSQDVGRNIRRGGPRYARRTEPAAREFTFERLQQVLVALASTRVPALRVP